MRSRVVYEVTLCSMGSVHGRAEGGEERLIVDERDEWMPEVSRGDRVEIEYDESEDWRGEPVAARRL